MSTDAGVYEYDPSWKRNKNSEVNARNMTGNLNGFGIGYMNLKNKFSVNFEATDSSAKV